MSITIADLEKAAESIVEGVIDHEGLINVIAGTVGILPAVSLAEKALPLLAGVLQFLQQESGKGLVETFTDLINHLTPGQPNAPALAPDQQSTSG